MKACKFCGQSIADLARKCQFCHSFQDKADAPKKSFDVANLVVSFVGVMVTIGTVVAGVLGYLGFKTIDDLSTRAQKIQEQTLGQAREYTALRGELENLLIREQYDRFQNLFDNLNFDELHQAAGIVKELEDIRTDAQAYDKLLQGTSLPKRVAGELREMDAVLSAIDAYRDGRFEEMTRLVDSLPDDSIQKHRVLDIAYGKLADKAKGEKDEARRKDFIDKEIVQARRYMELAAQYNKKDVIAQFNYAAALLDRRQPQDLTAAWNMLTQLRKITPSDPQLFYNLAVYYVLKGDFGAALAELETDKALHGLDAAGDREFFSTDPDFEPLRARAKLDPKVNLRLARLLRAE